MMFARLAVTRAVARTGAKRSMSDAPKLHKFKDSKQALLDTFPPPDPHAHYLFNPPYNPVVTTTALLSILIIGYGTMYMGMRHQQIKQGYWK